MAQEDHGVQGQVEATARATIKPAGTLSAMASAPQPSAGGPSCDGGERRRRAATTCTFFVSRWRRTTWRRRGRRASPAAKRPRRRQRRSRSGNSETVAQRRLRAQDQGGKWHDDLPVKRQYLGHFGEEEDAAAGVRRAARRREGCAHGGRSGRPHSLSQLPTPKRGQLREDHRAMADSDFRIGGGGAAEGAALVALRRGELGQEAAGGKAGSTTGSSDRGTLSRRRTRRRRPRPRSGASSSAIEVFEQGGGGKWPVKNQVGGIGSTWASSRRGGGGGGVRSALTRRSWRRWSPRPGGGTETQDVVGPQRVSWTRTQQGHADGIGGGKVPWALRRRGGGGGGGRRVAERDT